MVREISDEKKELDHQLFIFVSSEHDISKNTYVAFCMQIFCHSTYLRKWSSGLLRNYSAFVYACFTWRYWESPIQLKGRSISPSQIYQVAKSFHKTYI